MAGVDIRERISRKRSTLQQTIAMSAAALTPGDRTRDILCPNCFGGNSKEKSFAIQKEKGKILYKCWRATCNIKGVIDDNGSLVEHHHPSELKETHPGRRYQGVLGPIPTKGNQLFWDKYRLIAEDLREAGVTYCASEERYAFPVNNPVYQSRGLTLRSFDNAKALKWDHYQNFSAPGNPWMGWYIRPNPTGSRKVVVVEDAISALKISRQFKSCFLNGTNLSLEKLLEISKVAGDNGIIFALDKDATSKAIELARSYAFFVGDKVSCALLPQDAKYLTDTQIRELFDPPTAVQTEKKDVQI